MHVHVYFVCCMYICLILFLLSVCTFDECKVCARLKFRMRKYTSLGLFNCMYLCIKVWFFVACFFTFKYIISMYLCKHMGILLEMFQNDHALKSMDHFSVLGKRPAGRLKKRWIDRVKR